MYWTTNLNLTPLEAMRAFVAQRHHGRELDEGTVSGEYDANGNGRWVFSLVEGWKTYTMTLDLKAKRYSVDYPK